MYPELGEEINTFLLRPIPEAARGVVNMAERELNDPLSDKQRKVCEMIRTL